MAENCSRRRKDSSLLDSTKPEIASLEAEGHQAINEFRLRPRAGVCLYRVGTRQRSLIRLECASVSRA